MRRHELSDKEFYEIATAPTSNEMFDNGAWLAPVLNSLDPEIDRRANHAVHYYAEDAKLSVCGNRFGPDHYVETFPSSEETRKRCIGCTQLLAAVQAGSHPSKSRVVSPLQDVYTSAEFTVLIQGSVRIAMRINRMLSLDGDLYLLIDEGMVPARSLRRGLRQEIAAADEIVLIWADEAALDRLYVAHAQRLANERQREERRVTQLRQDEDRRITQQIEIELRRAADQRAFEERQASRQAALDEQDRLYAEMLAPVITSPASAEMAKS